MKYKKNKLRLNEMQGFYFLVEYGLVLICIYVLKVYLKKSCSILLRKKCSIHYLHFSFEKYAPSQVLKDFSVENVKTIPNTFLSKFSSEIYLSRIINYWCSILTLYLSIPSRFEKICELYLKFVNVCVNAYLGKNAWKSRTMCETWQAWYWTDLELD